MATRFYVPAVGSTAPSVSPAFGAAWGVTTNAGRAITSTAKSNTTLASTTAASFAETSATAINVLQRQGVSDALAAQTISGTFSAVFRGGETATAANAYLQVVLRVVSNDGSTQRAILYAGAAVAVNATANAIGQEFTTGSLTRIFPAGTAISSYTCVAGDRLVIEVGQRFDNTTTASQSGYLAFGDPTVGADHTLAAGTSTLLTPWVELTHNVTWDTGLVSVTSSRSTTWHTKAAANLEPGDHVGRANLRHCEPCDELGRAHRRDVDQGDDVAGPRRRVRHPGDLVGRAVGGLCYPGDDLGRQDRDDQQPRDDVGRARQRRIHPGDELARARPDDLDALDDVERRRAGAGHVIPLDHVGRQNGDHGLAEHDVGHECHRDRRASYDVGRAHACDGFPGYDVARAGARHLDAGRDVARPGDRVRHVVRARPRGTCAPRRRRAGLPAGTSARSSRRAGSRRGTCSPR